MQIIPAILTNNTRELDELLRRIRDSHKFSRAQIDFIDGEFADNLTIKPSECDLIPYLPVKFDAHLMVVEKNIVEWSKLAEKMGFDRLIAQMESISSPEDYSELALDVHSPVRAIEQYLAKINYVVVMTIEPGFGGQKFDELALDKIRRLGQIRQIKRYNYKICVDGGVEKEHMAHLESLGVDEVAVGAKRVLTW